MKTILTLLLLISWCNIYSQNISGVVVDENHNTITGANIYFKGSYEGCSTDLEGKFNFNTKLKGEQILIISFLGYKQEMIHLNINKVHFYKIILQEQYNKLNTVTISGGNYNSSSKTKVAALKPLDVLTTAGSTGNLVSAFMTLPGTSNIGESGKLYIRGGSSRESKIFIDGLRVFNPYTAAAVDTPVRSRFSPLLFKGMNFNTGGYSAEYGQALSGILLLDTEDIPNEEYTNINIMNIGVGVGKIKKWANSSITLNGSHIDLSMYNKIFKTNTKWIKPYNTTSSEAIYRYKTNTGIFKIYTGYTNTQFALYSKDINQEKELKHLTKDKNIYINTNYKGILSHNILLKTGFAFSINKNTKTNISNYKQSINIKDKNYHYKIKLTKRLNNNITTSIGSEHFYEEINIDKSSNKDNIFLLSEKHTNNNTSFFVENDFFLSKNTALRIGLRGEYSSIHKEYTTVPRINFTHRINKNNNLSFSYGIFHQDTESKNYWVKEKISIEKSKHYIINYQYKIKGKTLRVDIFHKKYSNLLKYEKLLSKNSYTSNGSAYANGIELFWRDNLSIKNLEYWISYSYLDTKRNYKNYPYAVRPNFSSKHNISLVTKYWIKSIKSLLSVSYSFNSGRPYNNPNKEKFMNETSPNYNNLSLSISYLINKQSILFASISNILGFDKFVSISKNKNKNQLYEL